MWRTTILPVFFCTFQWHWRCPATSRGFQTSPPTPSSLSHCSSRSPCLWPPYYTCAWVLSTIAVRGVRPPLTSPSVDLRHPPAVPVTAHYHAVALWVQLRRQKHRRRCKRKTGVKYGGTIDIQRWRVSKQAPVEDKGYLQVPTSCAEASCQCFAD